MITDFFAALSSKNDFKIAWKRLRHIRNGHGESTLIDKLTSEKHPHTNDELLFSVNIMRCNECGLIWVDSGLEYRVKWWIK